MRFLITCTVAPIFQVGKDLFRYRRDSSGLTPACYTVLECSCSKCEHVLMGESRKAPKNALSNFLIDCFLRIRCSLFQEGKTLWLAVYDSYHYPNLKLFLLKLFLRFSELSICYRKAFLLGMEDGSSS